MIVLATSTSHRRRVFLFGNGLSVAFNPDHYDLATLTGAVRSRLGELTTPDGEPLLVQVDGIVEALARDQERRVPLDSFEALAGPIDRLASMFTEIRPLTALLRDEDQERGLRDLGTTLRILYKRVVGAVLVGVIAHEPGEEGWEPLNEMAAFLIEIARRQGSLDVFILNYDALLDSALLIADAPGVALLDEFQGFGTENIPVYTPDRELTHIAALPWRSTLYEPSGSVIRRHHLHGAAMWMRFRGYVYKAHSLDDLREARIYRAWAEGVEGDEVEGQVEPVVLLGDQKEHWASRWPFSEEYALLSVAVARAEEIVVAGYSFQDIPVNSVLSSAVAPGAVVTIVNSHPDIERIARAALGPAVPLRVIRERLPGGLARIDS